MKNSYDIGGIRNGNREEFRRLVDNNMDRVYAIALMITADTEDAGDVVQDAFVKMWEKRRGLKDGKSIEGLISKIVINKSYDRLRRKKREAGMQSNGSILVNILSEDEADRELNNKELSSIIKTLCNGLSPKQKLVFTLVDLEQMSHDEVMDVTGMNKNSIKSNLSHARQKIEAGLRKYLK